MIRKQLWGMPTKLFVPVLAAGLLAAEYATFSNEIAPAAFADTARFYDAYYEGSTGPSWMAIGASTARTGT